MKAHLPALLVLSICAAGWSCSSSDTSVQAGAGGSMGLAGAVGIAGNGTVATGGNVGAAGASSALGGNTSAAGMGATGAALAEAPRTSGAGTAGSASGGVGTAGTGTAGAGTSGTSGTGGGSIVVARAWAALLARCSAIANTATRPQLNSTDAAKYTILKYLAQSDNWDPTAGLGNASSIHPEFHGGR